MYMFILGVAHQLHHSLVVYTTAAYLALQYKYSNAGMNALETHAH